MKSALGIVGAPSSAGAYAPGQERAPAAFRRHGLAERLVQAGASVNDHGDAPLFRWRADSNRPEAMNLHAVEQTARSIAATVSEALAMGERVLVLGGDCTVELGTVAGSASETVSTGLIYIDLDVDLNPPHQSDGALDWTGVAHLLDLGGTAPELTGLGRVKPLLRPSDVLFFAADNITAGEANTIAALGMKTIPLGHAKSDPSDAADEAARWAADFDQVLIHLDFDVLDFIDFPIAENTRRRSGLTLDELSLILVSLLKNTKWSGLTLTEINPDHTPDEAVAFQAIIGMLVRAIASEPSGVDPIRVP